MPYTAVIMRLKLKLIAVIFRPTLLAHWWYNWPSVQHDTAFTVEVMLKLNVVYCL